MSYKHNIDTELQYRIQSDINAFDANLPERYAIAWHGYLAALLEWQVINLQTYKRLVTLLPPITEPNPVTTIFSGRD